jgi:hypothetical protein
MVLSFLFKRVFPYSYFAVNTYALIQPDELKSLLGFYNYEIFFSFSKVELLYTKLNIYTLILKQSIPERTFVVSSISKINF